MSVAAECDGREDCDEGVCCAEFSPTSVRYERIACSTDCTSATQFALCHPGERCSANESLVCRRSLILPFEFLGVCAAPSNIVGPPSGPASSGEITCGDETCEVGRERCCLRASFDFRTQSGGPLEPTCVGMDEPCNCDTEVGIDSPDEVDSGADNDAG
jgi:hypothetical protein